MQQASQCCSYMPLGGCGLAPQNSPFLLCINFFGVNLSDLELEGGGNPSA